MPTCELTVTLRGADGALLRVLALIERRGFRVGEVDVGEPGASDCRRARLVVHAADRSFDNLAHQLGKLVDVVHVVHVDSNAG